jgi:hypothetical protein
LPDKIVATPVYNPLTPHVFLPTEIEIHYDLVCLRIKASLIGCVWQFIWVPLDWLAVQIDGGCKGNVELGYTQFLNPLQATLATALLSTSTKDIKQK